MADESPPVWILHGALGSRLGIPGRVFDDELWFDPFDVRRDHLDKISFGPWGDPRVRVLGIMRGAYLPLKLALRARGLAARFRPYDWRRDVRGLGADLARELGEHPGPVDLVCHSYGGLVARAAIAAGATNIRRVVTLGTPHRGAVSTALLLRGTHPVLLRLAALERRQDPAALAARVFGTFPGTYALLPQPGLVPGFDAFDPGVWPAEGPRPDPDLLAQARADLAALAPVDDRFHCVAGVDQDTPLAVTGPGEAGFGYQLGRAGDSVVPIESAAPPGGRAWYTRGGHGTLPWVRTILAALPELLTRGETAALAREPGELPTRDGTDDARLLRDFSRVLAELARPRAGSLEALLTEYAAPAPETVAADLPVAAAEASETPAGSPAESVAPLPPAGDAPPSPPDRLALLRRWAADPNAYALLQPDLRYFDHGGGFLAYRRALMRPVVLGDPAAPPGARPGLFEAFVDRHPGAVFFNLGEAAAAELHDLDRGYRFCPFGSERVLDLTDCAFLERKRVRGALKKAKKGGLALEEVDLAALAPARAETLAAINREFLARTPSKREITFISRGVALAPEPDVRVFSLREGKGEAARDFGFLVLDPYYRSGSRVGYQLNAIRFRRTKIWGVYYSVVARLFERLASEGDTRLSLGGLAFDMLDEPAAVPVDPRMRRRLEFVRDRTDEFYVMSHFTDMKLELGGAPLRRFAAIGPGASVTRSVLRLLRASGMI